MSSPTTSDNVPLTLSAPSGGRSGEESNPDNGEWGWSALGSEDDGVDDGGVGGVVPSGPGHLVHDNSVNSVLSVDSTTPQVVSGRPNMNVNTAYKPRSPNSNRRSYGSGSANSTPRGEHHPGFKGIPNSASFNELEKAIGQTLALSISSSNDSADGPSPVRNNSSSKLSSTNLTQQKLQHQRMRQHHHENRRTSPYAQSTPRFFPTGPQSFTVMGMSVSTSIKSELGQFINEGESRAIIIFHSPQVTPVAIRNACSKYGVLYYIRPDFHGRGVTFISYFDLRNAVTAKTSISEELGPDSEVSAHYSVTLHATNSNTEEFRLIVKDLPNDGSIQPESVENIFKRYGALKSFEKWTDPNSPGSNAARSSVVTVDSENPADDDKESIPESSDTNSSLNYSVEYYNIQDARLAASELSATSIPGWSSETKVIFAPLDERKQQLCRQLLATISRWRNEMSAMYQQINANNSPLASPMHGQHIVHSNSSSSIVSLGGTPAFPPMITPTGPYTTMFDRASPLTLDPSSAMVMQGGVFYSNSAPNSANNLVAMMTAAPVPPAPAVGGGGAMMIPSVMSNEQLLLHHQQQQHALQQAQLQMQYMQNIQAQQQQFMGGHNNLTNSHGSSFGSHDNLNGSHSNYREESNMAVNNNKDHNVPSYGLNNNHNKNQGGQYQHLGQQHQQQQHQQPQQHQQLHNQPLNLNANRPHHPFPSNFNPSNNHSQQQQQSQQSQYYNQQQSSHQQSQHHSMMHPRPHGGNAFSNRTPSPNIPNDDNNHHNHHYDSHPVNRIPPHHLSNGPSTHKVPHHHNGGHNPPQYHQQLQQQQQHNSHHGAMYGGLNPSYLQNPRGAPVPNRNAPQMAPYGAPRSMAPPYGYGNNVGSHPGAHHMANNNSGSNNHQIDENFAIDLNRISHDKESRTTIMVRNIPNKYNQTMLLEEVNVNHEGTYDFFYLPIDFKNRCNVGYCFINFLDPKFIPPFVNEFNGQRWNSFNSEKVCAVSFARIQGKQAMIARFQNSSLLEKDDEYQPLLFYSHGPDKGKPEPFPSGNRQRHPQHPHYDHDDGYGGMNEMM